MKATGEIPRQAELGVLTASDSWYRIWDIEGCVFANELLALNVRRIRRRFVEVGICPAERLGRCAVSVIQGNDVLFQGAVDLDPSLPWTKDVPAPVGGATVSITSPHGELLAHYRLAENKERSPRGSGSPPAGGDDGRADALEVARKAEILRLLDRRVAPTLDEIVAEYERLSKKHKGVELMIDIARAQLKNLYLRSGRSPVADRNLLASAEKVLRATTKRSRKNSRARFYLGLVVEQQGDFAKAAGWYNDALKGGFAAPASGVYLARIVARDKPKEAAAAARRAVEAYPMSCRARQMLLLAFLNAGNLREAVDIGRELHRVDPADPITVSLMAEAWKLMGSSERQAKFFQGELERMMKADSAAPGRLAEELDWLRGVNVNLGRRGRRPSSGRNRAAGGR